MIDTTTSAVAIGVIVTTGQWAKTGEPPKIKVIVGMLFMAYFLALLSAGNQKLGSQFAALILVGAVLAYAIPITRKLGLTK
jgi:phosphatidylglycerophosphate synthase